jgi:ABC-type oligopeptide transport system ATPase subunit
MFYGVINEGYIFDSKDIKYQVEEFEQGKVKTLFVTGHSGSGKSTLGHKYEKELGINCYELDDIGWNNGFTDEQLKEYGPEIYDWFNGPGKKYRLEVKKDAKGDWDLIDASVDFIKYILSKNARCIVEGIEIFMAIDEGKLKIEQFENSAMVIKGTSGIKSVYRSTKRDVKEDKENNPDDPLTGKQLFKYVVSKVKYMLHDEGVLREMRKRYKKKDKK